MEGGETQTTHASVTLGWGCLSGPPPTVTEPIKPNPRNSVSNRQFYIKPNLDLCALSRTSHELQSE